MLEKLKNFYLKLPKDILKAIEEAEYNRDTRRELKRYKKPETKIKHILKDEIKHQIFINYMYEQYNCSNIKYNDVNLIIDSINEDNFVQSMIYMLKNFYINKKFKEYVLSDVFDKQLEDFTNSDIIEKEKKDTDMKDNKENIDKYVVNIEEKNGFHNIYPLLKVENNKLIKVQEEDYPDYGNINVNPYLEFSKKKYDIISSLWICEFDESKLEDNLNKTKANSDSGVTKFKINGDELIKNKSIYSINKEGIYEIVEFFDDNIDMDKLIYNNKILIKNKPISQKVYIKDKKYIYGPFGYQDNNRGGGYYLDKKKNDYIVQKFSIEENKSNLSIIEIYNQYDYNNSYIETVYFYNKENLISESIDTIDNEELINKIKEIINNSKNIKYSVKEVQQIRNNIRYIIDNSLPKERINRIKTLIKNTEMTDEFIENNLSKNIKISSKSDDDTERVETSIQSEKDEETNYIDENLIDDFIRITKENNFVYDEKDLIKFHVSMKTSNLVILSGMSGIGKSRLVQFYAKALGIQDDTQLKIIPVRPSWNDDSDLLGYVDSIHMVYKPGDSGLLDILIEASKDDNIKDKLYIVCFDEMNLARVEHYFSQFLSVLEMEPGKRYLRLYSDELEEKLYNSSKYKKKIAIGDNIMFVGTVNVDESTYHFSDKVLDRANVINLKVKGDFLKYKLITKKNNNKDIKPKGKKSYYTYEMYDKCRISDKQIELSDRELMFFQEIHKKLNEVNKNIGIGYRIIKQIDLFIKNLPQNLPQEIKISESQAIDIQLVQRVLTKIRGAEEQLKELLNKDSDSSLFSILDKYKEVSDFKESRKVLEQKKKELMLYGYAL